MPPVSCETFMHDLDALLGELLEPGREEALLAHKASCARCNREFEAAKELLASFSILPPLTPRPHAIENLRKSIEAEMPALSADVPWASFRFHPVRRFLVSVALGLLAALASIFIFSQAALSLEGLGRTLLVCALFWVCGYTGMFDLALRKPMNLQSGKSFSLMRAGERVSVPVLLALGIATMGLLASLPFGGLRLVFSPIGDLSGSPVQGTPYSEWFLTGALIGGVSLLLGVNLGVAREPYPRFLDGVLSACLFILMISPGLALICVPFTLGLFATVSAGLLLGALSGGILGSWSSTIWRARMGGT